MALVNGITPSKAVPSIPDQTDLKRTPMLPNWTLLTARSSGTDEPRAPLGELPWPGPLTTRPQLHQKAPPATSDFQNLRIFHPDASASLAQRTWKQKVDLLGPLLNMDQSGKTKRLRGWLWASEPCKALKQCQKATIGGMYSNLRHPTRCLDGCSQCDAPGIRISKTW